MKRSLFESSEDFDIKIQKTDIGDIVSRRGVDADLVNKSETVTQTLLLDLSVDVKDVGRKLGSSLGIETVLMSLNEITASDRNEKVDVLSSKNADEAYLEHQYEESSAVDDDEVNCESHRTQSSNEYETNTNISS